jgi:hypothetical protein
MIDGWSPFLTVWVYWLQTLPLSVFSSLRILRFPVFVVEDIDIVRFHFFRKPEIRVKTRSIIPSKKQRFRALSPMLISLCFLHFIYLGFLVGEMNTVPNIAVILAGLIFFFNQTFTFLRQKKDDICRKVSVKDFEAFNMLRIAPIHLTLLAAAALRDMKISFTGNITLLIFLLLKTVIDIGMYFYTNKAFRGKIERKHKMIILDEAKVR